MEFRIFFHGNKEVHFHIDRKAASTLRYGVFEMIILNYARGSVTLVGSPVQRIMQANHYFDYQNERKCNSITSLHQLRGQCDSHPMHRPTLAVMANIALQGYKTKAFTTERRQESEQKEWVSVVIYKRSAESSMQHGEKYNQ